MTDESNAIVESARTWLGTRFHHQGRLKKTGTHAGGVDCLGLLVGIASELALAAEDGRPLASFDTPEYGHLPDGKALKAALGRLLQPIPNHEARPGDIALFALENIPRHLGLLMPSPEHSQAPQGGGACRQPAKWSPMRAQEARSGGIKTCEQQASAGDIKYNILHAYAQARKVVEHPLDDWWRQRWVATFRLPSPR